MLFQIQSVNIEQITKGKSRYSKATVEYTYNGEPRKQSIMSFSNPKVFSTVQGWEKNGVPTEAVEVALTKNDAGYSEWASINAGSPAGEASKAPIGAVAGNSTKVVGSNYETREERAARQVLIVKQSSLGAAVESLAPGAKAALSTEEVLERAQLFVDWVFAQDEEDVG